MLKILLAGLTGLITASRYDYGYHPSAEEFDNLLRETRRTWTHSFLKAERDRLLTNPVRSPDNLENRAKIDSRYFVPKFQYENNDYKRFQSFIPNPVPIKNHNNYDLHSSSSQKHPVPLQNIGSTLDFNYFSNELPQPLDIQQSFIRQPNIVSTTVKTITENKPITSALPEINLKPIAKPDIFNSNKYSLNNIYKNNTQGHFPIYFTNPATGIVYAITEVGKSTQNITRTNGSIPIFITKEQYERDIFQLKNEYEQKCQLTQITTTARPQIIRINKKQPSPALDITPSKFSPSTASPAIPLQKPSPVVVKTELTVKDKKPSTIRPLRKKKKKTKLKRKLKKQNPPGRKPLATTIRPLLANQPLGPAIIMGSRTTRKPLTNNEKLPTQLEKPNFDIFSSSMATKTPSSQTGSLNPNLFIDNHKINKRELQGSSTDGIMMDFSKNLDSKESTKVNFDSKDILSKFKEISSQYKNQESKYFKDLLKETFNDNILQEDDNNTIKLSNNTIQKVIFKSSENILKDLNKTINSSIKTSIVNNSDFENLNKLTNENFITESNKNRSRNSNSDFKLSKNNDFKYNNNNSVEDLKSETKDFNNLNLKPQNITKQHTTYNDLKSGNIIKEFQIPTINQHFKTLSELKTQNFANENLNNFIENNENISNIMFEDSKHLKHYINKRSTPNIKTNNTVPKFIKKSNATQVDAKNNTNENQELTRNLKSNLNQTHIIPKFRNNSSLLNKYSKIPGIKKRSFKRSKDLKKHKRKRLMKLKSNKNLKLNQTQPNQKLKQIQNKPILTTTPRTINMTPKNKKLEKKSERQDNEYYFFGIGESYDDEEDDDEGEDDEEEDEREEEYEDDDEDEEEDDEEDENERNEIFAYDEIYDTKQPHTSEVISVSMEELSEKPTQEVSSSPEEDNDVPAVEIERIDLKTPVLDYDQDKIPLKTKSSYIKKRIRRRPAQYKVDNDYYEEEDDDESSMSSNLGGFFRMIFYPIQVVMSSVMDTIAGKDAEEEEEDVNFNPYTQYTSYHNTLKQHSSDEYEEDYDSNESGGSSLSSWFSSWFGLNRRNKKIGSTTVAPAQVKPTKASSSSWLPSWLGFGANDRISTESSSTEDYDEYDSKYNIIH